jgi:hypothetical protein
MAVSRILVGQRRYRRFCQAMNTANPTLRQLRVLTRPQHNSLWVNKTSTNGLIFVLIIHPTTCFHQFDHSQLVTRIDTVNWFPNHLTTMFGYTAYKTPSEMRIWNMLNIDWMFNEAPLAVEVTRRWTKLQKELLILEVLPQYPLGRFRNMAKSLRRYGR